MTGERFSADNVILGNVSGTSVDTVPRRDDDAEDFFSKFDSNACTDSLSSISLSDSDRAPRSGDMLRTL